MKRYLLPIIAGLVLVVGVVVVVVQRSANNRAGTADEGANANTVVHEPPAEDANINRSVGSVFCEAETDCTPTCQGCYSRYNANPMPLCPVDARMRCGCFEHVCVDIGT